MRYAIKYKLGDSAWRFLKYWIKRRKGTSHEGKLPGILWLKPRDISNVNRMRTTCPTVVDSLK